MASAVLDGAHKGSDRMAGFHNDKDHKAADGEFLMEQCWSAADP